MTTAIITKNPLALVAVIGNDTPDPVFWPDGTATHGTSVGYSIGKYQFVTLQYDAPPNEFCGPTGAPPRITGLDGVVLSVARQWQERALSSVQGTLLARLDTAAEAARLVHITPGSGQAMVYLQKLNEANACSLDEVADAKNYPLLAASIGVHGDTITDVAAYVISTAARWRAIAAAIEQARLPGKAAIAAAKTVDEAIAAFDAAKAALP